MEAGPAQADAGIDTHGVDTGWDESHATNTQVHERNRIVLECLNCSRSDLI